MRKFWAVFHARNKEFVRDRASLGWSLFFPILLVFGFAFIFGGDGQDVFKVAVLGELPDESERSDFFATKHVQFVPVDDLEDALRRVGQHRFDLLLDPGDETTAARYWINSSSAKGYLVERILWGAGGPDRYRKQTVEGREVRYIDWLMPGLLAMNMMFGALFGVGYVIVRYRKMGVLRRLKATPLSAFEFLAAQVTSRMVLILGTTALVYIGSNFFLHFQMVGSYLDLILVFVLGALALTALGLVISARTSSEELAGGLLNLLTFPMMILSGVWFSLDGAPNWVVQFAKVFPLTHVNEAARAVMTDGAGLVEIAPQIGVLGAMTLVFLAIGAGLFRWE